MSRRPAWKPAAEEGTFSWKTPSCWGQNLGTYRKPAGPYPGTHTVERRRAAHRIKALPTPSVRLLEACAGSKASRHDPGRISPISHRDAAASATHARPCRAVVGGQGRLEARAPIRPAGRRRRRVVGSCLLASQGGRSGQRGVLVSPGRPARLPGAARCRVAEHSESVAETVRPRIRLQ